MFADDNLSNVIVGLDIFTEPVKLPDIPVVIKKKSTWTVLEEKSETTHSPLSDHNEALRQLKERKANLRTEYK